MGGVIMSKKISMLLKMEINGLFVEKTSQGYQNLSIIRRMLLVTEEIGLKQQFRIKDPRAKWKIP